MTSCQIAVTLKQTRNQINLPSLTGNYWNTESLQLCVRSIFLKYISMVQYLFKALSALDDEISQPPNRKEGRRWLIIKETTRPFKSNWSSHRGRKHKRLPRNYHHGMRVSVTFASFCDKNLFFYYYCYHNFFFYSLVTWVIGMRAQFPSLTLTVLQKFYVWLAQFFNSGGNAGTDRRWQKKMKN